MDWQHHRPLCPKELPIHYGQYQREELYDAARRSRACAYLADDDHGPLALQEILLAGCPTVGVRTGASLVRNGITGFIVDRLPPGRNCIVTDDDEACLRKYMETVQRAATLDRNDVRSKAAFEFADGRIVDRLIMCLGSTRRHVDL